MKYVIVWKEGSSILEDGILLDCKNQKEAIAYWLDSDSVKVGRHFILFFQSGSIYDDILKRKYGHKTAWRRVGMATVRNYMKRRIEAERKKKDNPDLRKLPNSSILLGYALPNM